MNSRHTAFALTFTFVLCSLASAAAPGKLTVEPPTLRCAGFHWEVSGAGDKTTVQIRFRKVGQDTWQKGMDFMQVDPEKKTYLAGSIFGLQPGTKYEAQLTLAGPVVGMAISITDLLDSEGQPLTREAKVRGIRLTATGLDPLCVCAVKPGK